VRLLWDVSVCALLGRLPNCYRTRDPLKAEIREFKGHRQLHPVEQLVCLIWKQSDIVHHAAGSGRQACGLLGEGMAESAGEFSCGVRFCHDLFFYRLGGRRREAVVAIPMPSHRPQLLPARPARLASVARKEQSRPCLPRPACGGSSPLTRRGKDGQRESALYVWVTGRRAAMSFIDSQPRYSAAAAADAPGAASGTNSNCASQLSCAQTGFFNTGRRLKRTRPHLLQVNCARKVLNSPQRVFSSPIDPPPYCASWK